MNLVSYEFVACQCAKHGVLILSEFAGAFQSLGAGAIRVPRDRLSSDQKPKIGCIPTALGR